MMQDNYGDHRKGVSNKKITFEVMQDNFKGFPTLEILKDGEAFWKDIPDAGKHFRFGVEKAKSILSCRGLVQAFLDSSGILPSGITSVGNQKSLKKYTVRRHDGFRKPRRGIWIEKPYLEIRGEKTISFGLLKSEAILQLEAKIRHFVIEEST